MTMNTNNDYKIKSVAVSTNGCNEIYFDVEWEGDDRLDYFELRAYEGGLDYCLESYAYPSKRQRVVVKPHTFNAIWKSNKENRCTIHVVLGIPEYSEDGTELGWVTLADYAPVELNVYYESYLFRKNVIELR